MEIEKVTRREPALREFVDLHKVLLDRERALYEKDYGPVGSPGEFLALALEHPRFAWLRELSGLIVDWDVERARELLRLDEDGDEFHARYHAAIQDSPDVVIAHCKAEQLLRS